MRFSLEMVDGPRDRNYFFLFTVTQNTVSFHYDDIFGSYNFRQAVSYVSDGTQMVNKLQAHLRIRWLKFLTLVLEKFCIPAKPLMVILFWIITLDINFPS